MLTRLFDLLATPPYSAGISTARLDAINTIASINTVRRRCSIVVHPGRARRRGMFHLPVVEKGREPRLNILYASSDTGHLSEADNAGEIAYLRISNSLQLWGQDGKVQAASSTSSSTIVVCTSNNTAVVTSRYHLRERVVRSGGRWVESYSTLA